MIEEIPSHEIEKGQEQREDLDKQFKDAREYITIYPENWRGEKPSDNFFEKYRRFQTPMRHGVRPEDVTGMISMFGMYEDSETAKPMEMDDNMKRNYIEAVERLKQEDTDNPADLPELREKMREHVIEKYKRSLSHEELEIVGDQLGRKGHMENILRNAEDTILKSKGINVDSIPRPKVYLTSSIIRRIS